MIRKSLIDRGKARGARRIAGGAAAGGILGAIAAFLDKTYILPIPMVGPILASLPVDTTITGAVLGAFIGGGIGGLIDLSGQQRKPTECDPNQGDVKTLGEDVHGAGHETSFQLREEQLDISKQRVQTGEVIVHKEFVTEEKSITLPVTREELVIETKILEKENPGDTDRHAETIRIPLREERIEITKQVVDLGEVAVNTREFQETVHVEEVLKKEKLHMEVSGEARLIDKDEGKNM